MSDTPRTDHLWKISNQRLTVDTAMQHAEHLERELCYARTLLDRVYGVWMSDNTGNDFIDALDPVMHEVAQFCRGTSNK